MLTAILIAWKFGIGSPHWRQATEEGIRAAIQAKILGKWEKTRCTYGQTTLYVRYCR